MYHLILRGNNCQNLFYKDNDRSFFIKRMKKYADELNIDIYGYCLMNNHVHMLIGKANEYLSLFVQKLANSYVYYFNHKYERSGHLFQGRFKSEPINDDIYFKTVLRYILQNSENAGMGDFTKYPWNSYHELTTTSPDNSTNYSYVFKLFGSQRQSLDFILIRKHDICMEYENKMFFSDSKVYQLIKAIFNIKYPSQLKKLDFDTQVLNLKRLKALGISINQIARVTDIPKKIIKTA